MEYQPSWLTFEIQQALAQLPTRLHRETVLRLAEAQVVGRPMADTFKLPGVCSHRTWYGRTRKGNKRPGWKDDTAIQQALALATSRAQWWADNVSARSIQQAQEKLASYSPGAVERIKVLMDTAESEMVQLKAAGEILDRAAIATAPKGREAYKIEMTWGDDGLDGESA